MSREDAPMLRVWNSSLSYSTDRDKTFDPPDVYFEDGMTVTEAGLTFTIAATPGHTRGGVCIIGDGVVFVGDTIFLESIGRTDLPGGSYDDILTSIKTKLLTLPDDYRLFPGHGPDTNRGLGKTEKSVSAVRGGPMMTQKPRGMLVKSAFALLAFAAFCLVADFLLPS